MEREISVLLVDDHTLLVQGLRGHLDKEHIRVVGEARNASEAQKCLESTLPDLVFLDISLTNSSMNGLELAQWFVENAPDTKVIMLTMFEDEAYVHQAVRYGVKGYLLKDEPIEEMIKAIKQVHGGGTYFSARVSQNIMHSLVQDIHLEKRGTLTRRERQVLALIADEFINKEIAEKLDLSVRTVESYRERIMTKLDIHTVAGLTKYAIRKGLVSLA